jgi:hypothetical protein
VYYDFLLVQGELRKLIKNLEKWTAPERVGDFSLLTFPSSQWRGGGCYNSTIRIQSADLYS